MRFLHKQSRLAINSNKFQSYNWNAQMWNSWKLDVKINKGDAWTILLLLSSTAKRIVKTDLESFKGYTFCKLANATIVLRIFFKFLPFCVLAKLLMIMPEILLLMFFTIRWLKWFCWSLNQSEVSYTSWEFLAEYIQTQ